MPFFPAPVVEALTPIRAGAGGIFVVRTEPNRRVKWTLTGHGTLTAVDPFTDAGGVAMAKWNGAGASSGDSIVVRAEVHE